MEFITIDSIIADYIDLTGTSSNQNKSLYKKWADFLLSKMPYLDYYDHKIKFDFVDNYQCEKPAGFHQLIQMAFSANNSQKVTRTEVVEWTQKLHDGSGCELVISMECEKCHKVECTCDSPEITIDVDRLWELNHPEYRYGHMAWYYRHGGLGNDNVPISPYHSAFHLIGPSKNTFFNADQYIKGCLNFNTYCTNASEQFVIDENVIRFNVESGRVVISYFSVPVDDEGYRKVPNVPELIEAIVWFIEERMAYREYKKTKNASYFKESQMAMAQKERFMGIAREKLLTQDYHEFQKNIGAFYGRFLPSEDICGNVTDLYHTIMSRFNHV